MDEDWLIQWQRNYMAGGQMQPPTQMSGQQTTAFSQEMSPLMFGGMNGFNGLNGMNAVGSDAIGGMSGLGVMNGMGIQNGIMARMNGGIMGMGGFMGIGGMMGMGAMNGGIGGMTSAFGPAMFSQMQQPSNSRKPSGSFEVKGLGGKIDSFGTKVDTLELKISEIEYWKNKAESAIIDLEHVTNAHEKRISNLSYYNRRNCLEIHGVPENPTEDLMEVVADLGAHLGVYVDQKHFDVMPHRLPSKYGI
ncbi:hypothetical protein FOCC_FOCC014820 [Frankliniella occidentalis]|nr:hypothetical protein FOCC_FOCC014820 [Frankliniella occidentalis]